ncbi:MAG: Methyltransferase type 11 [Candidatus Moranbacteria bacterium GW2011_GWC2_37_73]|nr:MAG: methyltransferase type 11 [Parcubacteria group bacterium GW2011_GWC1_36_108]KKQ00143.1 MAG: Methyltransferase type 11 [Candidatus Moranbacteria bacterium GW2011_GWD1_36_198]KKQ00211.1 MAG: Methyltransferase type 11 [Candidatus Moranbacteria bacterium GW2011_GWD2_36_198]KKQ39556.1 MAG: Methyltransferase type 11 [Candidatus Moranbacteria bacterium GW2011_GWC2_37_73]HAS00108.1 hypothetical protein [Candidatus Moranbacteria bacterium]
MKLVYSKIKKWYNENLEIYLKNGDVLMQDKLDKFLEYIPKKGKILDIGSGTGRDVNYFIENNFDGIGIDFSEKMIDYANKNFNGKFSLMEMTALDFQNEYFNGIWASSSLFTHLTSDDIEKALLEVERILACGGVFGFIVMKKEKNDIERKNFIFNKFTKKDILKKITDIGLTSFYVSIFHAHNRDWFYVLAKKGNSPTEDGSQQGNL